MQNADQIVETVQQLTRGIAEIRDETYRLLSRTVDRIISGEIADEADVRKILNLILDCGTDERMLKLTGKLCKYIDLRYPRFYGNFESLYRLVFADQEESDTEGDQPR